MRQFKQILVSLGDTIGVGSVGKVNKLLDEVLSIIPTEKIAVHFHDTYGQALSNVLVAINVGFKIIQIFQSIVIFYFKNLITAWHSNR